MNMVSMTAAAPPAFAPPATGAKPHAAETTTQWTALPGGVVDGGEIVLLAIKPSAWRPVFESASWLVACAALAMALAAFGRSLAGLSTATTVQLVLLIGFARLALAIVRWVPSWYVLTNRRIIEVQGMRNSEVVDCGLLDVRNTTVVKSPLERMTQLGTIAFVIDHEGRAPRVWHSVAKPDEVHARIRRAIENAIDQHGIGCQVNPS